MESWPDESTAKRRKLRKGTHSCHECRRRKVKCLYATPDDAICVVCERRGAHCISQYDSPGLSDAVEHTGDSRDEANVHNQVLVGDPKANDGDLGHADKSRAPLGNFPTPESTVFLVSSVHRSTEVS